MEPKFHYRVH